MYAAATTLSTKSVQVEGDHEVAVSLATERVAVVAGSALNLVAPLLRALNKGHTLVNEGWF